MNMEYPNIRFTRAHERYLMEEGWCVVDHRVALRNFRTENAIFPTHIELFHDAVRIFLNGRLVVTLRHDAKIEGVIMQAEAYAWNANEAEIVAIGQAVLTDGMAIFPDTSPEMEEILRVERAARDHALRTAHFESLIAKEKGWSAKIKELMKKS
jgi:hypothetical protein